MRLLALCLVCFVGFAFASGVSQFESANPTGLSNGGPGTDALLFDQPYAFGFLLNGFAHGFMCDDFELTGDASIDTIRVWMIYAIANPTEANFSILEDAGLVDPNFATPVWTGTLTANSVDTGDDNWGYDIWETTYTGSGPTDLVAGQLYWLSYEFHDQATIFDYWLVSDPVWGDYCWTGADGILWTRSDDPGTFETPADAFFQLMGTYSGALDNATWGTIKSTF